MKGLIVAAGYGTRMLPLTKAIPKELLPLADRPALELVVREFIEAGITDIIIITSRRKRVLEDYFDVDFELETILSTKNDHTKLQLLHSTSFNLNISFIRQPRMQGSAHAITLARPFVGKEPVAVAYPDDIFIGSPSPITELTKIYQKTRKNVVSLYEVPREEVHRYGVAKTKRISNSTEYLDILDMIEKPRIEEAPSNLIVPGRYVFTPEFFEIADQILSCQQASETSEVTQTEVLKELIKENKVVGVPLSSVRIDTGKKLGYFIAQTVLSTLHEELGQQFKQFLKNFVENDFQPSKKLLSRA